MPQFFDRYIHQVQEDNLMEGLENSLHILKTLNLEELKAIGDKVYETGKWKVKDILQHIIDTERIMSYRALRIARNDQTVLPGYDEELFGRNTFAFNRTIESLIEELIAVRIASILLFKSLEAKTLHYVGTCFNQQISPLALGFVIVGHQLHHLKVIREKYISLV